jgi:hypothetical protein
MNTKRGVAGGLAILAAVTCLATAGGCAKSPTVVNVQVAVDDTVAPLVLLRSRIALQSDPAYAAINDIVSRYEGDGGLAGPFIFPMLFPVAVPTGWAGDVVITVEGLNWQDGKVAATGTTSATATREQTTEAAVTLTGVAPSGTDGGTITDANAGSSDAAGAEGGTSNDGASSDTAD